MSALHEPEYVPALRFRFLTPLYDALVGATTRERTFKDALIRQARFAPGQRALDLATGTGTLAIWIKQRHPDVEVTGVDIDAAILAIAMRKARRADVAIRFERAPSHSLPYPDASFDRVVSSLFFHHLPWQQKVATARELARVLKPGGELHVADWGRPANHLMRALFLAIRCLDGFDVTRDNAAGRLISLFEQAGLVRVAERARYSTMFGTLALYSAVRAPRAS